MKTLKKFMTTLLAFFAAFCAIAGVCLMKNASSVKAEAASVITMGNRNWGTKGETNTYNTKSNTFTVALVSGATYKGNVIDENGEETELTVSTANLGSASATSGRLDFSWDGAFETVIIRKTTEFALASDTADAPATVSFDKNYRFYYLSGQEVPRHEEVADATAEDVTVTVSAFERNDAEIANGKRTFRCKNATWDYAAKEFENLDATGITYKGTAHDEKGNEVELKIRPYAVGKAIRLAFIYDENVKQLVIKNTDEFEYVLFSTKETTVPKALKLAKSYLFYVKNSSYVTPYIYELSEDYTTVIEEIDEGGTDTVTKITYWCNVTYGAIEGVYDGETVLFEKGWEITEPENFTVPAGYRVIWKDGDTEWDFYNEKIQKHTTLVPTLIKQITVAIDAKNGSAVQTLTIDEGSTISQPAAPEKAAEGETTYSFIGWFVEGTDNLFDFNAAINDNVTIEARYEEFSPVYFTVTFVNGETRDEVKVKENEKVAAPENPVKEGYDFVGWFKDGEEKAFDFNAAITADVTLTAKFEKHVEPVEKEFTVTFVNGETRDEVKVKENEKVAAPENPVKEGYDFVGWFKDGEEKAFDFNAAITADVTLTAKFEKIKKDDEKEEKSGCKSSVGGGIAGLAILSAAVGAIVFRKKKD